MPRRAAIIAIRSSFPERRLTNEELVEQFDGGHVDQILSKTGIAARGVAAEDECASDLGVAAAKRLFAEGVCLPDEIDFLIFCTQSPDYFTPATACLMQDSLGLRTSCGAVDISQGCSGFVYSLALANGLIESETAKTVLLVTGDTYTKFINPRDRTLRTLFGDGAAATVIRGVEAGHQLIGPFVLGTDGSGANHLIVKAGGLRRPHSPATATEYQDDNGNWRADDNLYMNGAEMFTFAMRRIPEAVNQLLKRAGLSIDEVDLFVPHQANKFMLERLRGRMKIAPDKFWIDMEHHGNTVSSTIPIALESALRKGRIKAGDRVALVGFGVGFSWGATMIRIV